MVGWAQQITGSGEQANSLQMAWAGQETAGSQLCIPALSLQLDGTWPCEGRVESQQKRLVWLSLHQLSFKGKINLRNLPPETYKQVTLASRVQEGQGSMPGDGVQNGNGIGDEGWILSSLIPHAGTHFCEDEGGIKCNSHGPAGQIWRRARWASWPAPERTRS